MAKRRTKPCEFCAEEFFGAPDEMPNAQVYFEKYPDSGVMSLTVFSFSDDREQNGEETYSIPFHYCPECGRELGW